MRHEGPVPAGLRAHEGFSASTLPVERFSFALDQGLVLTEPHVGPSLISAVRPTDFDVVDGGVRAIA